MIRLDEVGKGGARGQEQWQGVADGVGERRRGGYIDSDAQQGRDAPVPSLWAVDVPTVQHDVPALPGASLSRRSLGLGTADSQPGLAAHARGIESNNAP